MNYISNNRIILNKNTNFSNKLLNTICIKTVMNIMEVIQDTKVYTAPSDNPPTENGQKSPENTKKRAVAYIRVSDEKLNIENQKGAIDEWAKKNGFEIVAWFIDEGISGAVPPRERQGYQSMITFCKYNNVKIIIFYDISRMARNIIEGLKEINKLMEEGFDIYTLDNLFYMLNNVPYEAMKKMILSMLLGFAEFYREDVRRRTLEAMKRLKKQGKLAHAPTIIDAYALYISKKKRYKELERDERELAYQTLKNKIKRWLKDGASKKTIMMLLREEYKPVNKYLAELNLKQVQISYSSVVRLIRKIERNEPFCHPQEETLEEFLED